MTGRRDGSLDRLLQWAVAARAERGTRGPARIAVLGEFNSGKTTLINAMLGAVVFPADIATRTLIPAVAQFAARPSVVMKMADGKQVSWAIEELALPPPADARQLHYRLPLEPLRHASIVDTPPLGLDDQASDRRILQACRGADLLVWCTPAIQAWKHSEQLLWLTLPAALRRRGVLAVTFADQVPSEDDLDRLLTRLRTDAGPLFKDILIAVSVPAPAEKPPGLSGRRLREKASQH